MEVVRFMAHAHGTGHAEHISTRYPQTCLENATMDDLGKLFNAPGEAGDIRQRLVVEVERANEVMRLSRGILDQVAERSGAIVRQD